jgi:hypothetical protein
MTYKLGKAKQWSSLCPTETPYKDRIQTKVGVADARHLSRRSEELPPYRHDPSAAWGGGSLVQVHKGHAYVGAVGGSSYNGPEGFTVHDVRDPKKPKKVGEFRAPPGIHCHKLRIVGEDLLYVNSERLAGDKGKNARAGFFIFDVSTPSTPKPIGFYDMPGSGPHRFGVDLDRGTCPTTRRAGSSA